MRGINKAAGWFGLFLGLIGFGIGCGGPVTPAAGPVPERRSLEMAAHRGAALVFWETVQDRLIDGAHVAEEDLPDVFWMRESHREQVRDRIGPLIARPDFVELVVLVDGYLTDWLAATRAGESPADRTGLATFFRWADESALYGDTYDGERGVDRNGWTPSRLIEEGYVEVLRVRRGEEGEMEADFPPPWSD
jgi:hypothetical protein